MRLKSLLLALALVTGATAPAAAQQSPFSPVITVNDSAITGFELEQRARFLTMLRFPGDAQAEAEKGLIEDRLRLAAAKAAGIKLGDDQIRAGMEEFAARANLSADQFIAAIGQGGVSPETFRDFVTAGLSWRELMRAKYYDRVSVSEQEIDRAISSDSGRGAGPRVLLSELYIRARQGEVARSRILALKIKDKIGSEASFAEMTKLYSAGISRKDGGKVDWIPVSNLPPQVQGAISKLGQGQVSDPVILPGAVGLFLVRGFQGGAEKVAPASVVVDYAQFLIPAGADAAAEAARIAGKADRCDDLYALARGLPPGQLQRKQEKRGQIPGDLGRVLDGLDENETATMNRGGALALVMLCSRSASIATGYMLKPEIPPVPVYAAPGSVKAPIPSTGQDVAPAIIDGLGLGYGPSRDTVRGELLNRKIDELSTADLSALAANAIIVRP